MGIAMKVGFIDYYLDEWHANHYPQWFRDASNGAVEVAYAFAEIDSPKGGRTTAEWCAQYGIAQCATIEEIIEKSDALVILSPDNCERHELLSRLPLMSGKPCYIDKTFTPDLAMAKRIFAHADAYHTPCCSCSALRYAEEYQAVDPDDVLSINAWGPGVGDPMGYEIYSIHQLEPVLMLMRAKPTRVMMTVSAPKSYLLVMAFADGRYASISGSVGGAPFEMNVTGKTQNHVITAKSDYFGAMIQMLVRFLQTGVCEVPHEDTLAIMATREAGLRALEHPGEWIAVE